MEEERLNKTLPEDVLEMIIARVPFPYIFQARGLSKSWLARFSSVSSLQDAAMKSRAIAFQKLLRERFQHWMTFSPVSIDQIAYNRTNNTWQRMPSLRDLPWKANSSQQIVGPLLFASRAQEAGTWIKRCRGELRHRPHFYQMDEDGDIDHRLIPHRLNHPNELYVANMLTRSWKLLPPRPNAALGHAYREILVISPSAETYRVIVFCRDHSNNGTCSGYSAQIYDSKSTTWSSKQLRNPSSFFGAISSHAYFNGVIYMVRDAYMKSLLAYNVEAGTWKEIRLGGFYDFHETWCIDLVVCNSKLMMIVQEGEPPEVDCLHVLKVDVESERLCKVARCPSTSLNLRGFMASPPSSDGRGIFLGYDKFRMVAINVDEYMMTLNEKKRILKMRIKEKKEIIQIKEEKLMLKIHKDKKHRMRIKIKMKGNIQKEMAVLEKMKEMMEEMQSQDDGEEEEDGDEDEEWDDDDEDEDSEEDEDCEQEQEWEDDENWDADRDELSEEYWEEDEDEIDCDVFQDEWNFFHAPHAPRITTSDLRKHTIRSTGQGSKSRKKGKEQMRNDYEWCGVIGQGAKRSREPKDEMRNYEWSGSSFQPGLNPFMEV